MKLSFAFIIIWMTKTFSLPRIYYYIWQKRRDFTIDWFRQYERNSRKRHRVSLDIKFIQSCLDLDIFPTFVNFRVPYALRNLDSGQLKRKILRNELKVKQKAYNTLNNLINRDREKIRSNLTFIQQSVLHIILNRAIRSSSAGWIRTQNNKLFNLWIRQRPYSPTSIRNFSTYKLTVFEENALRLGLNNHICPPFVNKSEIQIAFEKLARSVDSNDRRFTQRLQQVASQYIATAENECKKSQNKALHRTLRNLRNNKSIKVCRFDKGSGTVVLDTDDYFSKLDSIVLSNKFVELAVTDHKHHPTVKTEASIQYYLNRYIKPHVSNDLFKGMYPKGSRPGAIYGLAKVHKAGTPLRPVISMINTPQYGLAKYLDKVIKPNIPSSKMLNSTNEFISKVNDIDLAHSQLVSYDVQNLFTNVPLEEIIDIACDYVYSDQSSTRPNYERKHFKKLLKLATSGEFLYKDRLFKQVDGVSMGSPLGPTLANLFLASMESEWLNSRNAPRCYLRYVDDIFAVFDESSSSSCNPDSFLEYLNSRHPNLTFTMEIGPKSLPFLDCLVDTSGDVTTTTVYRKPTNTGLLLNYTAFCPLQWKIGLIKCFLHRAHRLCSNWSLFNIEIDRLRELFTKNAYPRYIFDKIATEVISRLNNLTTNISNAHQEEPNPKIILLPYFGQVSTNLKHQLRNLNAKFRINCKLVFKPFKTASYFNLKSRCPKPLKSMVIYNFTCSVDQNNTYIGKTKRHLQDRVREHTEASYANNSTIFNHIINCNCRVNLDNFKILHTCRTEYDLNIAEAVYIRDLKPSLNSTLTNNGNSIFLKL